MKTMFSLSGVHSMPTSCSSYLVCFPLHLLLTSKISSHRHDALGFEYIDQSKNFVPQVEIQGVCFDWSRPEKF